ncbi:MAG: CidA/LrgA family protein [Colwellia sp.]|nr:CidA/LrgA family protein [Colwellia sp.]
MRKNTFITVFQLARSAGILLLFLYLGKGIQYLSHLPIPGSIFGLLLLFLGLNLRLVPLDYVLPTGSFLLNYITLFFVPVGVGLLQYSDLLSTHWLTIIVSSVISTIATLISVGWLYQRFSK